MPKILVFTDLHIKAEGRIIGLDPVARFEIARDQALADHPDAEMVVLTGDLTHSGKPAEYARLAELLAPFPMPVLPMIGNHDDRAAFRAAFPGAPEAEGFVQAVVPLGAHTLITLDSKSEADHHAGRLCATRLAFLDAALAEAPGPVTVFCHHPPFAIGFPGMDAIALVNGAELTERLAAHGRAYLVAGHVHRTISGCRAGVPFTIFKSPCHQAPLDLAGADSTASTDEAGAYGLLLLEADGIVAHSQDVGVPFRTISGYDALPEP